MKQLTLLLFCICCSTYLLQAQTQSPLNVSLSGTQQEFFQASCGTVTSITPSTANAGQNLNVTVSGTGVNFTQGSVALSYYSPGLGTTFYPSGYSNVNSSNFDANISVPVASCNTTYDAYVYYGGGCNAIIYNALTVPGTGQTPQITNVSPSAAQPGQTITVTISGTNTNFFQGSNITYILSEQNAGIGSTGYNVVAINSSIVMVTFNIPSNICGNYDLLLLNPDPCSNQVLRYNNAVTVTAPTPVITSVNTGPAEPNQTLGVTISGMNIDFSQGSLSYVLVDSAGFSVANGYNPFNMFDSLDVQFDIGNTCGYLDLHIYNADPCNPNTPVIFQDAVFVDCDTLIDGVIRMPDNLVHLEVYPNPTQDQFNLSIKNDQSASQQYQINMYNSLGQLVFRRRLPVQELLTLSRNDLPSGIYTLQVLTDDGAFLQSTQLSFY